MYHIEGAGGYYVQWSVGNNGNLMGAPGDTIVVHWVLPGADQITATLIDPVTHHGISQCTYGVTILMQPNPAIAEAYLRESMCRRDGLTANDYCVGDSVVFYAVGSGDFAWTLNGDSAGTGTALGISLTMPGPVVIGLTETNVAGCNRTVTQTYGVYALPSVSVAELTHGLENPITICRGEDLVFLGDLLDPNDFLPGSWSWEVRTMGALVATGSHQDFTYTFPQAGVYDVTLQATNCLGCASPPAGVRVIVEEEDAPVIVCPSVVCQSTEPVEYCTTAHCADFLWQVGGGHIAGDSTLSCVSVVWSDTVAQGYGTVTLTIGNCLDTTLCTSPTTVEVPIIPHTQVISGPASLCDPNGQAIYSVPYWPGAIYDWSIEGATLPDVALNGNGPTAVLNLSNFSGDFRVKVMVTHPIAQCMSEGSLDVMVRNFGIVGDSVYCYGDAVMLAVTPTPTTTPYTVHWQVPATDYEQTETGQPGTTLPFAAFGGSGDFVVMATLDLAGVPFDCDALIFNIHIRDSVPPVVGVFGPGRSVRTAPIAI